MNVHVPTTEEIHQIAFLTMRGWELVGDQWRKEDKTRKETRHHRCGCCDYQVDVEWFDTEAAYWEEKGDE